MFKVVFVSAMIFGGSVTAFTQSLEIGTPALQTPHLSAGPESTDGALVRPAADPRSFSLKLQPLNLLSNRIAFPALNIFPNRETLRNGLQLEHVPFAIDPILTQTWTPLRSLLARRPKYSELFLLRLRRLLPLSLNH